MHEREMNYYEIKGFCNFDDIYKNYVEEASNGDVFVEIGSLFGRSTAAMASFIRDSGKEIDFYSIDFWDLRGITDGQWGPEDIEYYKLLGLTDVSDPDILFNAVKRGLRNCGVSNYVKLIRSDSSDAVKHFCGKKINFLFIDGDHSYEGVKMDIETWLPYILDGGIIAGHDYDWIDVKKAVHECFPNREIISHGTSWLVGVNQ